MACVSFVTYIVRFNSHKTEDFVPVETFTKAILYHLIFSAMQKRSMQYVVVCRRSWWH